MHQALSNISKVLYKILARKRLALASGQLDWRQVVLGQGKAVLNTRGDVCHM